MLAKLHLAKDTFALQLLFQRSQSLVDVVIANKYLHDAFPFSIRDVPPELQSACLLYDMIPAFAVWKSINSSRRYPGICPVGLKPFKARPGPNGLIFIEFLVVGFDLRRPTRDRATSLSTLSTQPLLVFEL